MKHLLTLMATLVIAQPALAQTYIAPECAVLHQAYQRQADKGPDYVAGVDARGRPVVPAEGGAAPASAFVPNPLVVPVTVDLAKRAGIMAHGLEMSGTLGFLEIFADGRVLYNGQDLTQKVNDACVITADRQPPQDTIEYGASEQFNNNNNDE